MTWKKLNNLHFGGTDTFGGADIDKISQLFDGTQDIEDVDMNTNFPVRSGKFKFRNPNNTFSYNITPSAITTANKTVTLPVLDDTDDFLFENTPETIERKTLSNCTFDNPTINNLGTTPYITYPYVKRWGSFQAHGTSGQFDGILAGHTPYGDTISYVNNSPGGYALKVTTGLGVAGIQPVTGTKPFRTQRPGKIIADIWCDMTSNLFQPFCFCMGLVGWTTMSDSPLDIIGTTGGGGIAITLSAGETVPGGEGVTGLSVNNGSLANDVTLTKYFNFPDSGNVTHLELSWLNSGTRVEATLQHGDTPLVFANSSDLPSPTTDLYFQLAVNNVEEVPELDNLGLHIYNIWIETT